MKIDISIFGLVRDKASRGIEAGSPLRSHIQFASCFRYSGLTWQTIRMFEDGEHWRQRGWAEEELMEVALGLPLVSSVPSAFATVPAASVRFLEVLRALANRHGHAPVFRQVVRWGIDAWRAERVIGGGVVCVFSSYLRRV